MAGNRETRGIGRIGQSMDNLLADLPTNLKEEQVDLILDNGVLRLERIISRGHCSPPGFWYDQSEHEWVTVLQGQALLQIEGESCPRLLSAGDHLLLPSGCRHRVEQTSNTPATVWLALFFSDPEMIPALLNPA